MDQINIQVQISWKLRQLVSEMDFFLFSTSFAQPFVCLFLEVNEKYLEF